MTPIPRSQSRPLTHFSGWVIDRARRMVRVASYVAVVSAAISWFGLRSVRGSVGDAALVVGRQLLQLDDVVRGATHRVRLNGERVNFASVVVEQPLDEVLDRFQRPCTARSFTSQELLLPTRPAPAERSSESGTGVLRRQSEKEGLLACIVQSGDGAPQSFGQRLTRFVETLDLSEVGRLRYVYARKTEEGGTHVISAWTDGPFQLSALMPGRDEDAPGSDLPFGERPIDSVRLLSADIEGAPHSVRIYRSSASAAAVLAAFEADMRQLGWESLPLADVAPEGRAFARSGVDVLAFAYPSEDGGAVVSIVESSPERDR